MGLGDFCFRRKSLHALITLDVRSCIVMHLRISLSIYAFFEFN